MKKLTTIAVAAALAAPMAVMADTTLYGIVDTALVADDNGTTDDWGVGGNYSRIGVKGSEDLGNGLKAIFQYEWATDNVTGGAYGAGLDNRLGYVGLSGGFGTVTAGRQGVPWGATHAQVGNYDPSQLDSDDNVNTTCANCIDMAPSRTGNSIAYTSPNFNGFTGAVAIVADDDSGDDDIDLAVISLGYNNGPLSVALAAMDYDSLMTTSSDLWGIGAGYNFGNFYVGVQYEDRDRSPSGLGSTGNPQDDADYVGIGAKAFFGNNTVFVSYGDLDSDTNSEDRESWAVGINHAFSKRTMVYADYTDTEAGGSTDTSTFALGLRHSF